MKEAIVHRGPKVEIHDVAIPCPGPGQVVIKVAAVAVNPKDWKMSEWIEGRAINEGEDIAGTIHELGPEVASLTVGQRVAALHDNSSPHGGYAEYAVAWAYTTFPIPSDLSFEDASTIPLAAMTASWALYRDLSLPTPWNPAKNEDAIPLIISGGATAVGSFAIKLARLSNVHPIIATARRGKAFVSSLLDADRGDVCLDYQESLDDLSAAIKKALRGAKAQHAIEAVGDPHSVDMLKNVLESDATISMALPYGSPQASESKVKMLVVSSTSVHETWGPAPPGGKTFGFMMSQFFGYSLQNKSLAGHPVKTFSGLDSLQEALDDLKAGKASATKFVVTM